MAIIKQIQENPIYNFACALLSSSSFCDRIKAEKRFPVTMDILLPTKNMELYKPLLESLAHRFTYWVAPTQKIEQPQPEIIAPMRMRAEIRPLASYRPVNEG